ncbi:MAG: NAD(P)-dependent oxidoreductase [Chloroflexi bacterium]|nr:NAD-dependent epimerase/dehydratase family protein [Dehalococcoidia bacterium]NJD64297.1 NAD(P)-dependent oxidoreductase [Chloroflexota bacterium]
MNILVLGASGYIGSHLVPRLAAAREKLAMGQAVERQG